MEGNTSESTVRSLEGKILTARGLKAYARRLHFSPDLLRDQNILNFGSGGSNIGKELSKKGINSNVIDADIKVIGDNKFLLWMKRAETFLDLNKDSSIGKKLANIHAGSSKKDRNFVQADGRSLPFEDKQFDTVLALWSTYQIPEADKVKVFGELMRVGNAIHCGPITSKDFDVISTLCQEKGFDIITCRPFKENGVFVASNKNDYRDYVNKFPYSERVKVPEIDAPKVVGILDKPILAIVSAGNYIVLQRKSQ